MKRFLVALLLAPLLALGQTNNFNILDHGSGNYNSAAVAITGGTIDGTALGNTTPSSGKFTTLSASGAVSGTGFTNYFASPPGIGGTTPAAGAFTTLSATGAVSGSGFTTYLASPPAIGGTAAAAGSFTTLSASSTVSGAGFTTYLASPPAIGGTTPAAGSFTTLSASSTVSGTGFSTYLASPPAIGGTSPSTGKFTSITNTGLTANSFVYSGAGGLESSTAAPTNGQLLIGSTGAAPVAAALTGTANQIAFANGPGTITASIPSTLAIPGTVTSVNGVAGVNNGVVIVVATANFLNQTANVAQSTVYAVPAGQGGRYRVVMDSIVVSVGTTSTLPNTTVYWTDADTSGTPSANIGSTSTGNTISTVSVGSIVVNAKASTNIQIGTGGYASTGTAMQYNARYVVEYLGP